MCVYLCEYICIIFKSTAFYNILRKNLDLVARPHSFNISLFLVPFLSSAKIETESLLFGYSCCCGNRKCKHCEHSIGYLCIVTDTRLRVRRRFDSFVFSKNIGRQTRVTEQGSKTWKGYRNSLLSVSFYFLSLHLFSHFTFLFSLFFSLFSSPPSEREQNVQ